MIKLICIILLLGCDQFIEENAPLEANYYVEDGWKAFEEEDYQLAHQYFSATLVGGDNSFYPHAYVGLGWNCIYYANSQIGPSNFSFRNDQRESAYDYFQLAKLKYENLDVNSDSELLQSYHDYLSGMTYYFSYKAIEMSDLFYSNNNEQGFWDDMMTYSDSLIYFSNMLLEENSSYNFIHDELFDINNIKWLRAQTYVRLNQLEQATIEANSIESIQSCLEELPLVYCLNNCLGGNCSTFINP